MTKEHKFTIAAIADVHVGKTVQMDYRDLFADVSRRADVFLMCGDLTHNGLSKEAKKLTEMLQVCTIPKLAVLGNHDYHSGQEEEIKSILENSGVVFLEDEVFELGNFSFTGVKGFGGGYGPHTLGLFGEKGVRSFAQAAIDESEKLENNLENIEESKTKIVALHYSPIIQTVVGEPLEIYPFLGTSRLEEVIDRFRVRVVFHGHAHFGTLFGKTAKGADVYNVSLPVLQKQNLQYKLVYY